MPAASGRAAIQELFGGMMQGGTLTDFRLTTTDLRVSGDMARERGRYNLTVNVPGQGAMADSGKYVVVWQRQADGSWLMESDVWNSDIPASPPAAADSGARRSS
jgi:ketosteroid isomerase-like protein